jgi:hypothetical protein
MEFLVYTIIALVGCTAFFIGLLVGQDERNIERERLNVRKLEALKAEGRKS